MRALESAEPRRFTCLQGRGETKNALQTKNTIHHSKLNPTTEPTAERLHIFNKNAPLESPEPRRGETKNVLQTKNINQYSKLNPNKKPT